jgi:FlaA1/EpsC-like NDP-sugar epimerase
MSYMQDQDEWSFFDRTQDAFDESAIRACVQGKRVLITGAGGFIGSALARSLSQLSADHLFLLDIAESGLHELALELDRMNVPVLRDLIVGDVCDAALLAEICSRHGPQIVLHAGACKHVSLMEGNPFAAARTNVLGTLQIVQAANAFGVDKVVVISTDKAVAPVGIMGVTKRIAELVVLTNSGPTQVNAVRLGNVLGSTGSVVPILQRQIVQGGPLTITDAACTRYFVTIDGAVQSLLSALLIDVPSTILVSQPGNPHRIVDVARLLMKANHSNHQKVEIRFTGLRPGEKLFEQMTSDGEVLANSSVEGLQQILHSPQPSHQTLALILEEIRASLRDRDLVRLVRAMSRAVPGYLPSSRLQEQIEAAISGAKA